MKRKEILGTLFAFLSLFFLQLTKPTLHSKKVANVVVVVVVVLHSNSVAQCGGGGALEKSRQCGSGGGALELGRKK